jgi:hypothetical protein
MLVSKMKSVMDEQTVWTVYMDFCLLEVIYGSTKECLASYVRVNSFGSIHNFSKQCVNMAQWLQFKNWNV